MTVISLVLELIRTGQPGRPRFTISGPGFGIIPTRERQARMIYAQFLLDTIQTPT